MYRLISGSLIIPSALGVSRNLLTVFVVVKSYSQSRIPRSFLAQLQLHLSTLYLSSWNSFTIRMAEDSLLLAISQLRTTGKYSDLTLVCQQQEFRVHKAIVCSQSTVLAAACDGDLKQVSIPGS